MKKLFRIYPIVESAILMILSFWIMKKHQGLREIIESTDIKNELSYQILQKL